MKLQTRLADTNDHISRMAPRIVWGFLILSILAVVNLAYSQPKQSTQSPSPSQKTSALQEEKLAAENAKLKLETAKLRLETSPLQEEKLAAENAKLKLENENNNRNLNAWLGWRNLLFQNVSILVAIVLGCWVLFKYLRERREELIKREDERFEEVVKGLGSEIDQQRVSSAVLLPTFLRPGYERFYIQVFNLAAGNLRPMPAEKASGDAGPAANLSPIRTETVWSETAAGEAAVRTETVFKRLVASGSYLAAANSGRMMGELLPAAPPPNPVKQALVSVLRESFYLARDAIKADAKMDKESLAERYLNANGINLEDAFLAGADFRQGWWRGASFRRARLTGAKLAGAVLEKADFSRAGLSQIELCDTNLKAADFFEADLENGDLSNARIDNARFINANLTEVIMNGGTAGGANFSGAILTRAKFSNVDFARLTAEGEKANPQDASTLSEAVFEKVTGLTRSQIDRCKTLGAKFLGEVADEAEVSEGTPNRSSDTRATTL